MISTTFILAITSANSTLSSKQPSKLWFLHPQRSRSAKINLFPPYPFHNFYANVLKTFRRSQQPKFRDRFRPGTYFKRDRQGSVQPLNNCRKSKAAILKSGLVYKNNHIKRLNSRDHWAVLMSC